MQNIVDKILQREPAAMQNIDFQRGLTIAANLASYWGGGEITLVSTTFNPTLEFAKKFAKFTVQCSTSCCVVGREGVERDNLAINYMSNGGTTREAVYDVTVRVRCSRALRVTSITGPGITKVDKAPFMLKDGSLLLQYGETPRMALESLEVRGANGARSEVTKRCVYPGEEQRGAK